MEHSFLAPSGAYKWRYCSFNPSLEASMPEEPDTPQSREGTAAHEMGEAMIRSYMVAGNNFPLCGGFAENGELITPEIYESAKVYADAVREIMVETGIFTPDLIFIERKVFMPQVHHLNWGTPDVVIYDRNKGVIYLIDFKHGHRSVLAYENWQLIDYANGVLKSLGMLDGIKDQHIRFEFRIIMPRCFDGRDPVRSWSVQASDLRGYFNQLELAAQAATSGHLVATPGTYCRDCDGYLKCDALRDAGAALADFAQNASTHELDGVALGFELDWLGKASALMNARLDTLQTEAKTRALKGETVAGWSVENTVGPLAWSVDKSIVVDTGNTLGFDFMKEVIPYTPTQALKAVKGNEDATAAIQALSRRPNTGAKLKRDEDTLAHRVFFKN